MQTWLGLNAKFRAHNGTRDILFEVKPKRGTRPTFPSPQRDGKHLVESVLADDSDPRMRQFKEHMAFEVLEEVAGEMRELFMSPEELRALDERVRTSGIADGSFIRALIALRYDPDEPLEIPGNYVHQIVVRESDKYLGTATAPNVTARLNRATHLLVYQFGTTNLVDACTAESICHRLLKRAYARRVIADKLGQ